MYVWLAPAAHGAAIWDREMRCDAAQALSEARELVDDDASVTYEITKGQGACDVARAAQISWADLIVLPPDGPPRVPRLGFASLADRLGGLGAWDVTAGPAATGSERGTPAAPPAEWRRLPRASAFFIAGVVLVVTLTAVGIYH